MSTILVQFVGMSCSQMIITMKAGRSVKRKQRKKEKELLMQFVRVNTCMYNAQCSNTSEQQADGSYIDDFSGR